MIFGYFYLMAVAIGLWLAYFLISFTFARFFVSKKTGSWKRSALSCAIIVLSSLLISVISLTMPHGPDNRFLHAFGGGFMVVLVCFLSFRDRGFQINRFQFAIMAILMSTALGTTNEMLEFFLQANFGLVANAGLNDTWLDLASNLLGMLIALPVFVPFVRTKIVAT